MGEDTSALDKKKTHRERHSGRKAEKKKGKKEAENPVLEQTAKQRNPKAFAFNSAVRAERRFRRKQDIETKKQHVPVIDRTPIEPPPIMIAVVGPPKVGKTTVINNLIRLFTKSPLTDIKGPVTIVTGKKRRITLVECNNDINSMIDIAKVADLVLLLCDASFGFEMEIFEFLNICQVHGMPRIMGVLTHLDMIKNSKTLKNTKKILKHRFWTEVYPGAKLFYLSGIVHGEYLRNEIKNLGRFVSIIKFRPLTWRTTHSYLLGDRYEDLTSQELIRQNPKCDRNISLYGYVRGVPLVKNTSVHIAGLGDLKIHDISYLPDPCPLPDVIKKRSLVEKEKLIYAPFSGVGGIVYDKDAVYVELGGSHSHRKDQKDTLDESKNMVSNLIDTKQTLDFKMQHSEMQIFTGGKKLTADNMTEAVKTFSKSTMSTNVKNNVDSDLDEELDELRKEKDYSGLKEEAVVQEGRTRRKVIFGQNDNKFAETLNDEDSDSSDEGFEPKNTQYTTLKQNKDKDVHDKVANALKYLEKNKSVPTFDLDEDSDADSDDSNDANSEEESDVPDNISLQSGESLVGVSKMKKNEILVDFEDINKHSKDKDVTNALKYLKRNKPASTSDLVEDSDEESDDFDSDVPDDISLQSGESLVGVSKMKKKEKLVDVDERLKRKHIRFDNADEDSVEETVVPLGKKEKKNKTNIGENASKFKDEPDEDDEMDKDTVKEIVVKSKKEKRKSKANKNNEDLDDKNTSKLKGKFNDDNDNMNENSVKEIAVKNKKEKKRKSKALNNEEDLDDKNNSKLNDEPNDDNNIDEDSVERNAVKSKNEKKRKCKAVDDKDTNKLNGKPDDDNNMDEDSVEQNVVKSKKEKKHKSKAVMNKNDLDDKNTSKLKDEPGDYDVEMNEVSVEEHVKKKKKSKAVQNKEDLGDKNTSKLQEKPDDSDDDSLEDLDIKIEDSFDEEIDDEDMAVKWKENLHKKARDAFIDRQRTTQNIMKLVYGVFDKHRINLDGEEKEDLQEDQDDIGGLFRVIASSQKRKIEEKEQMNIDESSLFNTWDKDTKDWLEPENKTIISNCFVTGKWKQSEDASELLKLDDMKDYSDEEEVFGDFEDLETGEKHVAEEAVKTGEKRKYDVITEEEPLTRAQLIEKKRKLKEKFDADYDNTENTSYYDDLKTSAEKQAQINKAVFEDMPDDLRVQIEGFRPGMYVRIEFEDVPSEFITNFDPTYPLLIGALNIGEENIGYVNVKIKKHRWYKKILKTGDPLIISLGWRRFQTLPLFSKLEDDLKYRYLKYTPEHVNCNAHFWGPITPQGTGFLALQSVNNQQENVKQMGFRVAATGSVQELEKSTQIMKKLKLIGHPQKIYKKTAFIKDMFNSALEVAKFEGARIKTVSGIRGQIKKATGKPEGTFRATFEDKILLSDIVFCRTWYKVDVPKFYNPVTTLLLPHDQKNAWQGVRTTGQIKRERGVQNEPNFDSLYTPIEREEKPSKLLVIPRKLQKILPYRDRPKFAPLKSDMKPNPENKRVAVIREPREQKVAQMLKMLRASYQHKQAQMKADMSKRMSHHQAEMNAQEDKKNQREKRERKEIFRKKSKAKIREEKKGGKK